MRKTIQHLFSFTDNMNPSNELGRSGKQNWKLNNMVGILSELDCG